MQMLGLQPLPAMKKCTGKCKKWLPHDDFKLKIDATGAVIGRVAKCTPCRIAHNEYLNNLPNRAASLSKASAKYKGTDKRKVSNKRAKESVNGRATKKRWCESEKRRRVADPVYARRLSLKAHACGLLNGTQHTSPTFIRASGFATENEFINHVRACYSAIGKTLADRGNTDMEHKIPVEAYDFSNPEDVRRCWSAANVWAMDHVANMKKNVTIDDLLCHQVGVANWPVSWNGQIPTDEEKRALYAKWKQAWAAPPAAGPSNDVESSDDDSDSD